MNWDPAKHPRGEGGRFGNTVGGQRLKDAGVKPSDKIVAKSKRVRKYAGHATVEDYAKSHPRGRAHALRELAADHKAGKIGFVAEVEQIAESELSTAGQAARTYVAPDRSKLSSVSSDLKPTDYLTRTNNSKKYPPGITVGAFLSTHPKGPKYAARVLKQDMSYGRVIAERPTADIVRPPRLSKPAVAVSSLTKDVNFGAGVSSAFAKNVHDAWNEIPAAARSLIKAKGFTVHAPSRLIDTAPELADQVPRGWAEGSTWKDVAGICMSGADKKVIVAETARNARYDRWESQAYRAKAALMHEIGHAVDRAANDASTVGAFRQAYSRDVAAYLSRGGKLDDPRYAYFLQPGDGGPSEMFAEQFAGSMGYACNHRDPPLRKQFPETAAVMDKIIGGLRDA